MKRFIAIVLALVGQFGFAQEMVNGASQPRGFNNNILRRASSAPANHAPSTPEGAAAVAAANAVSAKPAAYDETGTKFILALDFNAAPNEVIFKAYAEQTGKTIIPAPDVPKVSITLHSESGSLTKEEYLQAIEVTLAMNGILLQPFGKNFIKAIPRKTARVHGMEFIKEIGENPLDENTRVASQLIQFKHIAAADAQKALEGFKDPSGLFQIFERNNAILVTDIQENINRMLEIVKIIDVPMPVNEEVFVREIKYAAAADIRKALETIVTESQKETQKESSGTKLSGGPGFGAARTSTQPNRLLAGPGRNPPPAPTANETMIAGISDADRGMIRGKVLILDDERSNKLIVITMKTNMDFFDKVIEQLDVETTPDTVVKVYRLKYAEAEDVADMMNDLIGNSSNSKSSAKSSNQNTAAKSGTGANMTRNTAQPATKSANQRTGEAKAGELSKENTTVLADKRINGIVVMTNKELIPVVESIIESMDIKLSQVLIETCIIEVALSDTLSTGIDWVKSVSSKHDGIRGGMSGGGGTTAAGVLEDFASKVAAPGVVMGPGAAGLNYFMASSKLNLSAIVNASKNDSRSKYIASPIIMTLDNKEAVVNATKMQYLLKGFTSSGNSYSTIAVPDYEQKELGIGIKVTPKINPNGTVMLTVEEKFSQKGESQTIKYANNNSSYNSSTGSSDKTDKALTSVDVPTTVTREMSADVLLENRQTVIFGGLTETKTEEENGGIPILKDIPYIGKWLFGKVKQVETRTELLVFMTPYVLDDSDAAQAEAIRRKNTMSDARPWEDHGWSLSELADPVSEKEQLRRIRNDWERQDEDLRTRIAIEKAKGKRMNQMEKLTPQEREILIKLHEEELEKERKREQEKNLQDEKSQEELKALAEKIREREAANEAKK